MKRIEFFLKGMLCVAALGFAIGGASLLLNSCAKDGLNAEKQRQIAEGQKWLELLKSTRITPPAEKDRVATLVSHGLIRDSVDISFPSFGDDRLLRQNVDDQYSPTYIAEVKQKVSPLVQQSITYIETYGFTETDFISTLGIGYDPALVIDVAAFIQAAKNDVIIDYSMMDAFPFVTRAYADAWSTSRCILGALTGIDLELLSSIRAAGSYFEMASRKAIIKMVGRMAARYVGFIGAAIIAYDIVGCLMADASEMPVSLDNWIDKKRVKVC